MELKVKKLSTFTAILLTIGVAWFFLPMSSSNTDTNTGFKRLVLTGSSTVAPLASEIGKRFESLHQNVRVDVQTGGSSRGINDARSGLANIGMASRALKENEADLLSFTIALDGISIIINQTNPVSSLDKQQIIDIYTGRIVNWQGVQYKKVTI